MSVKYKLLQAAAGRDIGPDAWFSVVEPETTSTTHETKAIAIDSQGYIYSVGEPRHIIKHDKSGNVVWVIEPVSAAVGTYSLNVDSNDNIIVGAEFSSAIELFKLNSDGLVQWKKVIPINGIPISIATDSNDDIYLAGHDVGYNNQRDTLLLKISGADGSVIGRVSWDKGATLTGVMSNKPGVHVDSNDNVLLTTYEIGYGSTGTNAYLASFPSDYSLLGGVNTNVNFIREFVYNDGSNSGYHNEYLFNSVTNANNDVYAVGMSASYLGYTGANYPQAVSVAKLDSAGNTIFHKWYRAGPTTSTYYANAGTYTYGYDIALDSQENFAFIGFSADAVSGVDGKEIIIGKCDSSGTLLFARSIAVTAGRYCEGYSIEFDAQDNMIVSGRISDTELEVGERPRPFIAKLPGDGSGLGEYADPNGTLRIDYKTWDFQTGDASQAQASSIISSGLTSANTTLPTVSNSSNSFQNKTNAPSVLIDYQEKVLSGYWTTSIAYETPGTGTTGQLPAYYYSVDVDSDGNTYAAGQIYITSSSADRYGLLSKFNANGEEVWHKRFNNPLAASVQTLSAVKVTSNNDIVVAGHWDHSTGSSYSINTIKLDSDANILWKKEWGTGGATEQAKDLVLDSADNVYVVGTTNDWYGSQLDGCLIKYNTDGTYQGQRFFGSTNNIDGRTYVPEQAAIDSQGNIVVVGYQDATTSAGANEGFIAVFDSNLNMTNDVYVDYKSSTFTNGSHGIAIDSNDNYYYTFSTNAIASSINTTIAKFNSSLSLSWQKTISTPDNPNSTYSYQAVGFDSNDRLYLGCSHTEFASLIKMDVSGNVMGPSLKMKWNDTYGNMFIRNMAIDANDDITICGFESNPVFQAIVMKVPNDFRKIEKSKWYWGQPMAFEFTNMIHTIVNADVNAITLDTTPALEAGTARSSGNNSEDNTSAAVLVDHTFGLLVTDDMDLVTVQDEFLTSYNYEDYFVSTVTVNVDNVFSTATDQSAPPTVQYPHVRYQFNRYAPGEWFERAYTSSGSFMFNNSNRALVGFESDISATDVAALIDVDFDNQTYTTLLNDSNFTSLGFNNIRYVEGGSHLFVSAGSANSPGGYRFDTQSAFTPSLPGTASNNNSYKFYDPILNSVHEGSYDTQGVATDLWTFQANTATVLTEDASSYVNQGVDVGQRHWVPISMDEDYIYWIDHERCGYSEKGSTVNDTITDGTYTILAVNTGIANNPGNNDTWAWRDNDAWPDIFGNIWMRSSNSADTNYNKYRRIYRDPSTGIPQITATNAWEDPFGQFAPESAGSYAYLYRLDSVGRPDWQIATLYVYDAEASLATFPKYKIYSGGTPSSSPYNYTFEGPYGNDLSGVEVDGKTLFVRTLDSSTQFSVKLYRMP